MRKNNNEPWFITYHAERTANLGKAAQAHDAGHVVIPLMRTTARDESHPTNQDLGGTHTWMSTDMDTLRSPSKPNTLANLILSYG